MTTQARRRKADLVVGEAWKAFASTPEGKVALADLMTWCNVYTDIDETDPIRLAMAEGERRVALRIARLMSLKPSDFVQQADDDTALLDRMMRSL